MYGRRQDNLTAHVEFHLCSEDLVHEEVQSRVTHVNIKNQFRALIVTAQIDDPSNISIRRGSARLIAPYFGSKL